MKEKKCPLCGVVLLPPAPFKFFAGEKLGQKCPSCKRVEEERVTEEADFFNISQMSSPMYSPSLA